MFIRPWLETLKSHWVPAKRRTSKRLNQKPLLQTQVESLEERVVLAAFELVTVIPNQGVFLTDNSPTPLPEAPRELTLRFSPGQNINASTLGAITVVRAGLDGEFDDPTNTTLQSTDDVVVPLGYVGIGDNTNEVILRFASTLPDDKYQIRIQATGTGSLAGNAGDSLQPDNNPANTSSTKYKTFSYEIDLGSQVEAVVPQPVVRSQTFSILNQFDLNSSLITITAGPYSATLELAFSSGSVSADHIFIDRIGPADVVAGRVADAINSLNWPDGVALTATSSDETITVKPEHNGITSAFEPVITFGDPVLTINTPANVSATNLASVKDGDLLTVSLGGNSLTFEFRDSSITNNSVALGHIGIDFVPSTATQATLSTAIAAAINSLTNNPNQFVEATVQSGSVVIRVKAGQGTPIVELVSAVKGSISQSYTSEAFAKTAVTISAPTNLTDGDTMTLTVGSTTLVLEFNNTLTSNQTVAGRVRVDYTTATPPTAESIADAIVAALASPTKNPLQIITATKLLGNNKVAFTATSGVPAVSWAPSVQNAPVAFSRDVGSLAQATDKVVVYFNQDALDPDVAEDPTYYRLLDASTTVLNVSDYTKLTDSNLLTVSLGATTLTFEIDSDAIFSVSNIRIDRTVLTTASQVAAYIADRINNASVNPAQVIKATVVGTAVSITGGSAGKPTAAWTTNAGAFTLTTKVLLPQSVSYLYNPANGLSAAVLTFGTALPNTTYNIQIGNSNERSGIDSENPIVAGTLYSNQDFVANDWIGDGVNSTVSSSTADIDVYQFFTAAAGTFTITLNASATLDAQFSFYNATTNQLIQTVNSAGLGSTDSFTTGILGNSEKYYVKVSSSAGTGSYTLTIHAQLPLANSDNNSSFDDSTSPATNLGTLGTSGVTVTGQQIQVQGIAVPQQPGGYDEPGHRDLPMGPFFNAPFDSPELGHSTGTDAAPAVPNPINVYTYVFPLTYGSGGLNNQISDAQKNMARQIFQIYSYYLGVQFREIDPLDPNAGAANMKIITGDVRQVMPSADPTTISGWTISGGGGSGTTVISAAYQPDPINSPGVTLASDSTYGGPWFRTLVPAIGYFLGEGYTTDVPSTQGGGLPAEAVYPGDNDLIHLLRDFPNSNSDIDLYKFELAQAGTLTAQTFAERLGVATNRLNTELTLYKEVAGVRTMIARNDDFYSKDSGLELELGAGTYYIGVTSTGNDNYDPTIPNSGSGGSTQGTYNLKLDFKPAAAASSSLTDLTGKSLDGDHDGDAGGTYENWFTVASTVFVDKLAPVTGGTGSVTAPYQTLGAALTAGVAPGSILRIVGNGGADGDASTLTDNVPYAIGNDYSTQLPLSDGASFQVPKDVTTIIDAGTLIKVHAQTIDVGTSSGGLVRSGGALQVLGTPANNVTITSWRDDANGSVDDGTNGAAAGADWGGIVFRQDSDSAIPGVFLNQVNHATLQYGGGQVSVDGAQPQVYSVIHLQTSRPAITNNTIRNNADSAISANPDSFKADDGRIGPDIHGNILTSNSTNGLFVRIQTAPGSATETLNVQARFDDTDITHVLAQNLIINANPAGAITGTLSARLMIDPGTIIKLAGARIETGLGSANLIAEGTAEDPIRFTSQQDDRFGIGGTFDLKNDKQTTPTAGSWAGIFLQPTSTASLDHVSIAYAGGVSEISGTSDSFNPIEVLQAKLRVTNSVFENNAGGDSATNRAGRGFNDDSVIYVLGAQPVVVNNVFRNNVSSNVISINANSMQATVTPDYGRSTGTIDRQSAFDDNYGPLVRLNTYENNATNGMLIRSEELTIQSIWDDTDIAHVVTGTITSNEFHTYGGLRLQSSTTGSLVVKLQGANAGFVATGDPLEIEDRIGGTVQVIGQPGYPVILTSLKDDTVSAGFRPNGLPMRDTNNDGDYTTGASGAQPGPGDWNSLLFDQYSNDRNVAIVNETEPALTHGDSINGTILNPQLLGTLAANQISGDETNRLGFEVNGFISPDSPGDVDVYSFTAPAGTEVWIDLDQTSDQLDAMVELVNAAGVVLARSLDSLTETANAAAWLSAVDPLNPGLKKAGSLAGAGPNNSNLNTLIKSSDLGPDFYTTNVHDAGFRAVLPGTAGTLTTYFVRVRSQPVVGQETAAVPVGGNGLTSGKYELQVRLRQVDEQPGSTVRYADIRYATNGIELRGLPAHSPLMGEAAEASGDNNSTGPSTQNLGNLLVNDRNMISVSGSLSSSTDVDYFKFTVDYAQIHETGLTKYFPTMFDIDWADGLTRPDTSIAVFNSAGTLLYVGRASDIADDQPAPGQGQDVDDLTRGSVGTLDPYLGTVNLPDAPGTTTYYVAVYSNGRTPTALTAVFDPLTASDPLTLVRLEPINSVKRLVEDHIGFTGYQSILSDVNPVNGPLFNLGPSEDLSVNIRPFTLSDVNLFVTSGSQLSIVDPYYGTREVAYDAYGGNLTYSDLDMRSDGTLYAVRSNPSAAGSGELVALRLDQANPTTSETAVSDGIAKVAATDPPLYQENDSSPDAVAWHSNGVGTYDFLYYAAASNDTYGISTPPPPADPMDPVIPPVNLDPFGNGISKLYRANASGSAAFSGGNGAVGNLRDAGGMIQGITTGLQYATNGNLYGVTSDGFFYTVSAGTAVGGNGNPDPDFSDLNNQFPLNLATNVVSLTGLTGGSASIAGLTDAPKNVEGGRFKDLLFAITTNGRLIAINPTSPGTPQYIFDTNNDGKADNTDLPYKQLSVGSVTGLGFSPVDFNLWHPTMLNSDQAGHGINSTDNLDNSRGGNSTEVLQIGSEAAVFSSNGGASMYFGLEKYNPTNAGNYFEYQSQGQYGVRDATVQQALTTDPNYKPSYNVPGGASGSLVTNNFSLEGYNAGDKPTLYFNYQLETEGASSAGSSEMRDSARVFVSVDNGVNWTLIATNNSDRGDELPSFLSTSSNESGSSNQVVQELYDTNSWRQARVDLSKFVGNALVQLRFDFSTSGRTGTVTDPATGLKIASDDTGNPTYSGVPGADLYGAQSDAKQRTQDNQHAGFFVDDIIIGFAGRGEMVTNAPAGISDIVNLPNSASSGANQLLEGDYQLEIRRGQEYAQLAAAFSTSVNLTTQYDINDRMTSGQTILLGNRVADQNTVTVSDGVVTKTFEFDTNNAWDQTNNIRVDISGLIASMQQGTIAQRLADAITAAFASRKTVIADAVSPSTDSDRVDLYGAVSATVNQLPVASSTAMSTQVESNDTMGTATNSLITPTSLGTYTGSGTIGTNLDVDFYSMSLTVGQKVYIDVDTSGDSVLRIFNSSGTQRGFNNNGAFPGESLATASYLLFVAPTTDTYYFAISGSSNTNYNPAVALSGALGSTFSYTLNVIVEAAPVGMSAPPYNRHGDDNAERQQGQFIVENNTILSSSQNGLLVNNDLRLDGRVFPGAVLNTPTQKNQTLVTGLYIQNNVIARFGQNGISLIGSSAADDLAGQAISPFVKVLNNTIYGGDDDQVSSSTVGIRVQDNISPTFMNNAIVNTGSSIELTNAGTTEIEATLFRGNLADQNTGNNFLRNLDINGQTATSGEALFVKAHRYVSATVSHDNFYPAASSPLVDSARSTFDDRAAYYEVSEPLGIPKAPLFATLVDRYGQLRVDDFQQAGPPNQPGLGVNPFQDRGAIERADFAGGLVIPTGPQDNGANGVDLDPTVTSIWIDAATVGAEFTIQTTFTLQLKDNGIGIDDSTVGSADFLLVKNGTPLVANVDYTFTYNENTNDVIFTSASTFALDSRYQIILNAAGIQDLAGNNLQNNQAAPVASNPKITAPFNSSLLYFTYVFTDGKNDGPVVSVGGVNVPASPQSAAAIEIDEEEALVFSPTNITPDHPTGTALRITDPDAFLALDGDPNTGTDGGHIKVTISILPSFVGNPNAGDTTVYGSFSPLNGALTSALDTFSFTSSQIVLEGRIDRIRAALDGLTFTPQDDFPANSASTVRISILTEDFGKFGPGAPASPTYIIPIQINPVNDDPTVTVTTPAAVTTTPGNVTILEDAPANSSTQLTLSNITAGGGETQNLTVTVTSSDPTIIPNPGVVYSGSSALIPAQLFVSFAPVANQFTPTGVPVTLTITISDGISTPPPQVVNVTVTSVNDAPTLVQTSPDPVPANEDDLTTKSVTFNVSAGPANEVQSLTYNVTVTPVPGEPGSPGAIIETFPIVRVGGTATLTYKAIPEAWGKVQVSVTAVDSNGATSATETFIVQINPVNDPPTITQEPDHPLLEDSGPFNFDLDGIFPGPLGEIGSIANISVTSPANGTIVDIVKGTFNSSTGKLPLTVTPRPDAHGPVTITVVVTDEGGQTSAPMTFKMDVAPVNDKPTLGPVPPTVVFDEDLNNNAEQSLALDGIFAGAADEQLVQNLTVVVTYDPTFVGGNPNLIDSFSYVQPGVNGNGQATFKYKPVKDAFGTARYIVRSFDGTDYSDPQTFILTVNSVNDAPTINFINNPAPILEDAGQRSITLTGVTFGPANEDQTPDLKARVKVGEEIVDTFEFAPVPGQPGTYTLKYKTVQDFNGTATIEVTAKDSSGATFSREFNVTITPVNDRPTLDEIDDQLPVTEDSGEHTINLTGISVGPVHEQTETPLQNLVFTVTSDNPALIPNLSSNLRIDYTSGSTGQLVYKALDNVYGTAKITVNVTDTGSPAASLLTPIEFTITVTPAPDAPTNITLSNNVALEQKPAGTLVGTLTTTDIDLPNDTSTYTIVGGNGVAFFTIPTGTNQLRTTQPLVYANVVGGFYTVTVRSTDSDGLFVDRTFNIVNSPNSNPTNITLSNDTIAEIPAGTTLPANVLVGTLTTTDPEVIDTHTYSLVGGADVAKFKIVGDQLIAVGPLDYDTQSNYSIVIRSRDSHSPSGFLDKAFTIHTTNVNEAATSIGIQANPISGVPNSIPENQAAGSIVGKLVAGDPDALDTATFALVGGLGSTDNGKFSIVNGNLVANVPFDYEVKSSYTVRIKTTDALGLSFETAVVISVTDVNEAPTNINLSDSTVAENSPATTPIGFFTTVDPDTGNTFTYSLVAGQGGTDNTKFTIDSDGVLRVVTPPDYEVPGHAYSIRVRSADASNATLFTEKVFSITITNVNEAPTGLSLSNQTVAENKPLGTVVGTLGSDDQDSPDAFTYTLVSGDGSDDNALFAISGDKLVTNASFDFETRTTYTVRVQTRDNGGQTFQKQFTITITDAFDAPRITLSGSTGATTGRKPIVVDAGAQIEDIDTTDFNGGRLVVRIQSGEQKGDTLTIRKGATFNGLTLKTVRGKTILRLGTTDIATVSGGVRAIPLTLQFGSTTSLELMQTVMQSITFRGKPFAAPRVVSMQVFDDKGLASNVATRNINVN